MSAGPPPEALCSIPAMSDSLGEGRDNHHSEKATKTRRQVVGGAAAALGTLGIAIAPQDAVAQTSQSVEADVAVLRESPLNLGLPEYAALQVDDDWSPVLQAGLEAASLATGPQLLIPKGTHRIETAIVKDFTHLSAGLRIQGQGAGSRLVIATGEGVDAITIDDCSDLVIDDVYFAGTVGTLDDCKSALYFRGSRPHTVTLQNCGFYGLSVRSSTGRAVLQADFASLRVLRTTFRGCAASSGTDKSVIRADYWDRILLEDVDFYDWGVIDGVYHAKSAHSMSPWGWLMIGQPSSASVDAFSQRQVLLRRVRMDEGGYQGVSSRFAAFGPRIDSMVLDDVIVNGSAVRDGTAFYLRNIDRLWMRDCIAGGQMANPEQRDGVLLYDVTQADLERVVLRDRYDRLRTIRTRSLILKNCRYRTLTTDESLTTLVRGTAPALMMEGGDLAAPPAGRGLVVVSPDGTKAARIGIDNRGALLSTPVLSVSHPVSLTGLAAWYKADAGTSSTEDGTPLSTWNDQSGNGRHLVQGTAAARPLYKSAIVNDQPVVRFDGVNDLMAVAFGLTQPAHVFIVFRPGPGPTPNGGTVVDGFEVNAMRLARASATAVQIRAGSWGPARIVDFSRFHQFEAEFAGDSSRLYIDGDAGASGDAGTRSAGGVTLGGAGGGGSGAWLGCEIAEILVYDTIQSGPDRGLINAYLRDRWATP